MLLKRLWNLFFVSLFFVMWISCQTGQQENRNASESEVQVQLSPEERLAKIKEELTEVKKELTKAGKYDCCIQPTCNWCALYEGECDCRDNLKEGEEVCPGCGLGWHNGKGVVEGVTADQVKWDITHEHNEEGHEH